MHICIILIALNVKLYSKDISFLSAFHSWPLILFDNFCSQFVEKLALLNGSIRLNASVLRSYSTIRSVCLDFYSNNFGLLNSANAKSCFIMNADTQTTPWNIQQHQNISRFFFLSNNKSSLNDVTLHDNWNILSLIYTASFPFFFSYFSNKKGTNFVAINRNIYDFTPLPLKTRKIHNLFPKH